MKKISSSSVLSYATKFVRQAQEMNVRIDTDKMKIELDRVVKKGMELILTQFLNTKPISSVQVNIVYDPQSKKVAFKTLTNNGNKEVEQEISTALMKFEPKTSPVVAKYSKNSPLDYKYLEMEV